MNERSRSEPPAGERDQGRFPRRAARPLLLAWLALLALMLTSLGSAYLDLGAGNVTAGVVIACIKTGLVVWFFMHLPRASAATRIAAAAGLAALALLVSLSLTDFLTRGRNPAAVQTPQQIVPWGGREAPG